MSSLLLQGLFLILAIGNTCVNAAPATNSSDDSSNVAQIVSEGPTPVLTYETLFNWKLLDFEFPSDDIRQAKLKSEEFIPLNNTLAGIKVHDGRIFLTIPRWRKGVPATLAYIDYNSNSTYSTTSQPRDPTSPLLKPYPSWELQQIGNCSAFQYVQSMEIDQYDRMWVIDVGRVDTVTLKARKSTQEQCPPKLSLINLTTNQIEHSYEFPSTVVDRTKNFLNDIVVGCTSKSDCIAFITDAWESRLVIYNLKDNASWSVSHSSMKATPDAYNITILEKSYATDVNIDGIALSPIYTNFKTLYFCPLSSYNLYSIDTSILLKHQNDNGTNPIALKDDDVKVIGRKSSQSDGLAMSSSGYLYYGQLENNSVSYINLSVPIKDPTKPIYETLLLQNDIELQWPDTFAFDNIGYLFSVTNRLQRFTENNYDAEEINLRIIRTWIGLKSYMYSAKDAVVSITIEQAKSATTAPTTTTTTAVPKNDDKMLNDGPAPHGETGNNSKPPQSLPAVINSTSTTADNSKASGANLIPFAIVQLLLFLVGALIFV